MLLNSIVSSKFNDGEKRSIIDKDDFETKSVGYFPKRGIMSNRVFFPVAQSVKLLLENGSKSKNVGKESKRIHEVKDMSGPIIVGGSASEKKTGKGRCTYEDGALYTGEFKHGKMQGRGSYSYASGAIYQGLFKNGMRHGKGKMTWPDGTVYIGNFKKDKIQGIGLISSRNMKPTQLGYAFFEESSSRYINDTVSQAIFIGEFKGGKINCQAKLNF